MLVRYCLVFFFFMLAMLIMDVPNYLHGRDNRLKNKNIGLDNTNNLFHPCPDTPNCVSSQTNASDKQHFIKPIAYQSSQQEAFNILKKIVTKLPRTKIISTTDNYFHVEFKSALFRFIDDVEFYFPINKKIIHVTSRSRVGHSDLGVNRKRIQKITKLFQQENIDKKN